MTPQDMAAFTAFIAIFDKIGAFPLITIVISVVVCPWIALFILNRGQEKRHAEVVIMYENNVTLVKRHEDMMKNSDRREDVLTDLLRLNTQAQTSLCAWLKERSRCVDLKTGKECHDH